MAKRRPIKGRRANNRRTQRRRSETRGTQEQRASTALAYQKKVQTPLMQNAIEGTKLVAQTTATGVELTRKAVDAAQSPIVIGVPTKWLDFWSSSLQAVQTHVSMFTTLSARALRTWFQVMRVNLETS